MTTSGFNVYNVADEATPIFSTGPVPNGDAVRLVVTTLRKLVAVSLVGEPEVTNVKVVANCGGADLFRTASILLSDEGVLSVTKNGQQGWTSANAPSSLTFIQRE